MTRKKFEIKLNDRTLRLGPKTLIMGVLNLTPDSFSDGGKFTNKNSALAHAIKMIEDGADIIDVGGESTRPGSEEVSAEEELQRVIPVIEGIRAESNIPISIDTYKAKVAAESIWAGANIINDISGCTFDPEMPSLAANTNTPIIIMHIKGTPKDMQQEPRYENVVEEIKLYLENQIDLLKKAGLPVSQIIVDPGIGFGKTTEHNLMIMKHLDKFTELNHPIMMGASRKSVIGDVLELPVDKRMFGTAATVAAGIMKGAHIIRVHDVAEMKQVATMTDAIIGTNIGDRSPKANSSKF